MVSHTLLLALYPIEEVILPSQSSPHDWEFRFTRAAEDHCSPTAGPQWTRISCKMLSACSNLTWQVVCVLSPCFFPKNLIYMYVYVVTCT